RADHTVIDTGHHRLLIGTIPVAPANYRHPGDPSVPLIQRTAGTGALQPVADDTAYERRCPLNGHRCGWEYSDHPVRVARPRARRCGVDQFAAMTFFPPSWCAVCGYI